MSGKTRSGFTMVECALAGAVVLVAVALLGLIAGRTRKMGQLGESMANLRRVGELTGSYGHDYQDRMWGLTWRGDAVPADADLDLRNYISLDTYRAQSAQAVQIMRRRGNDPQLGLAANWYPYSLYSTLALVDYAEAAAPALWLISPGDRNRMNWATDIPGFRRDAYGSNQPPANGIEENWRWSYSTSYDLSYAFYAADSGVNTVAQGPTHYQYLIPNAPETNIPGLLGSRRVSEVRHPSQKAMLWDSHAWYFGRRVEFAMMIGARVPVLMSDGSASVRTRDFRPFPEGCSGWNPRSPSTQIFYSFVYTPQTWEPAVPGGGPSMTVPAFQRWTRQGLLGRDFDGPEVREP